MDFLTLQAAKNYTDDTVEGMGIQKGKNCQIQSIEDITGGHRITFAWYDEDQVLQTDTVDIMNGPEGPEGPQGPQGEVGESGVGFGPVPEVMPEGVNWWVDPNGEPNTAATINDANVSEDETWSSKKISGKFGSNDIWDGVEEAGIINTSTGEDEESTNGRRMPHDKGIAVVPGDTYYIKKTTTAKIRYTFYAADGTYIGNTDALGNSLVDSDVMSQKMVPPAGATQFRAFASSSMVNAGLTVPAGVGADIDEINESITTINRDLADLKESADVTLGSNIFLRRRGKVVTIEVSGWLNANEISIPEDYRPTHEIFTPIYLQGGAVGVANISSTITTYTNYPTPNTGKYMMNVSWSLS